MKRIFGVALFSLMLVGCGSIDIGAYETGVEVKAEKLATFKPGITKQKEIEATLGHPSRKENGKGKETWYYDYSKIRHLGANVSESTVFIFNDADVLLSVSKVGAPNKNPLLRN